MSDNKTPMRSYSHRRFGLSFHRDAHAAHFAAEGRGEFRHRALRLDYLRESRAKGAYYVLRHALDGALLDGHLLAHRFVYGEIVHRPLHIVLVGRVAQLGGDREAHVESVAHFALQIVTAVVGAELHVFESDGIKHDCATITK